jgi:hypothetical protein
MNKKPHSYMQTDPRWAKRPYRVTGEDATIGGSGCGPTCAAMLITTLTGKAVTPVDTCEWSTQHGYKALNQGTYYSYFTPQFKAHGIICTRLNTANVYGKPKEKVHDTVLELLKDGYYIIACMGKGLWTKSGHYIVAWWCDGKVYINDPASTKEERLMGDLATFRSQVKYYWAVDAREYNKEDDDMSYDKFKEYMKQYEAEKAKESASDWAKAGLEQAKAKGITDGARPMSYATRQEVALMVNKVV